MEEIFDLTSLINKQKLLDEYIIKNHPIVDKIDYLNKLKLALIVEIGEFSNTTKCFKFWSNKGMMEKDVMLDEYSDILHFLLSLTYHASINSASLDIPKENDIGLTYLLLDLYKETINIDVENPSQLRIFRCWELLLMIANKLKFSMDEVINSYNKKMSVNYKRQNENY